MNYEINVSRGGKHFFGTHERSLRSFVEMSTVFTALRKAFTPEQGFEVTVVQVEVSRLPVLVPTDSVGDRWLQTK